MMINSEKETWSLITKGFKSSVPKRGLGNKFKNEEELLNIKNK